MIRGEIYYGDINLTLIKHKRRKVDNKILSTDTTTYKTTRCVFTTHQGQIVKMEHTVNRLHRKLPHHLQNHEIKEMTFVGGEKVGETQYDITPFIK